MVFQHGGHQQTIKSENYLKKKAIRILSDKGYSQHTDPLFSKFGKLKLSDLHKHNASTFMYKYIKEKLPSSFNGMFAPFVEPNRT